MVKSPGDLYALILYKKSEKGGEISSSIEQLVDLYRDLLDLSPVIQDCLAKQYSQGHTQSQTMEAIILISCMCAQYTIEAIIVDFNSVTIIACLSVGDFPLVLYLGITSVLFIDHCQYIREVFQSKGAQSLNQLKLFK